jgi:hypothetical protein
MPAKSRSQQRLMGAAYARAKSGHPRSTDPQMSVRQLRDFASTSTRGLPDRVKPAKGYGKGPLSK